VCLRKLQWSIGFDVLEYYGALERIDRDADLRTKLTGLAAALKPCAENDHVTSSPRGGIARLKLR